MQFDIFKVTGNWAVATRDRMCSAVSETTYYSMELSMAYILSEIKSYFWDQGICTLYALKCFHIKLFFSFFFFQQSVLQHYSSPIRLLGAILWSTVIISRHPNTETCGSVGESLREWTGMRVTYSEGLSKQLQLKLRNRILRKSGKRDKFSSTSKASPE